MPYKVWIAGETLKAADLNNTFAQYVNATADWTFTGTHTHNNSVHFNSPIDINSTINSNLNVVGGNITTTAGNITTTAGNITTNNGNITTAAGNITTNNGLVSDGIGNVRSVIKNAVTNGYTVQSSDNGKFLYATGDINMPGNIFNVGDTVTIFNNTGSTINIYQASGTVLYLSGLGLNGNAVIDSKGLCTILCVDTNIYVISTTSITTSSSGGGGGGGAVTESAILGALGYVPYNSSNPSLFPNSTNGFTMSQVGLLNSLGYTPYNASNPAGYITAADVPSAGFTGSYSSYSIGTTYTNTSEKPIFIVANAPSVPGGGHDNSVTPGSIVARVNDVAIAQSICNAYGGSASISFIVPPNSNWIVTGTTQSYVYVLS